MVRTPSASYDGVIALWGRWGQDGGGRGHVSEAGDGFEGPVYKNRLLSDFKTDVMTTKQKRNLDGQNKTRRGFEENLLVVPV